MPGELCKSSEQMMEESSRGLKCLRRLVCNGEGIPDDRLLAFVDAEGETADAASV